jgi:hypothetical protein
MKRVEGWLVIADISGYTAFLTGTSLDHAQAIVEELLSDLHKNLSTSLKVVKLEGDAIFAWAPVEAFDGDELTRRLVEVYKAFRMHVLSIERCMTCACDACSAARTLDLKFVVHRGELVEQTVGGVYDIQGTAAILVHRLLKNHVTERTGFGAYLIATEAVGFGPELAKKLVSCSEAYEHFGDVGCRILDLHAELEHDFGEREVRVERDDVVVMCDLPVPVTEAWAWHFDASRRREWDKALAPSTSMRLGGIVDCTHNDGCRVGQRIVDWRPHRYVSLENAAMGSGARWFPATRTTVEFEPSGSGSKVTHRVQILSGGLLGWIARRILPRELTREMRGEALALKARLSQVAAESAKSAG